MAGQVSFHCEYLYFTSEVIVPSQPTLHQRHYVFILSDVACIPSCLSYLLHLAKYILSLRNRFGCNHYHEQIKFYNNFFFIYRTVIQYLLTADIDTFISWFIHCISFACHGNAW